MVAASAIGRPVVEAVVSQHVEDASHLREVRSVLVRSGHVQLHRLKRTDELLAAHLDGIAVAGPRGAALCRAGLARPGVGIAFVVAIQALQGGSDASLRQLLPLVAGLPEVRRGVVSAFGWAPWPLVEPIARSLLGDPDAALREVGVGAWRVHGVDPGPSLVALLADPSPAVRCAALRLAGELGRVSVRDDALAAAEERTIEIAFRGAVASCLLGDRGRSLDSLETIVGAEGELLWPALPVLLCSIHVERGREIIRRLGEGGTVDPRRRRLMVRALGWLGDVRALSGLIALMEDDAMARAAGEAFSLITGVDLAAHDLERPAVGEDSSGPSDDPDDPAVDIDDDDGLPWPDAGRVHAWWRERADELPRHGCWFIGGAPTSARCAAGLRLGGQRQRGLAALRAALATPDAAVFNVCAPAGPQERLLTSTRSRA